MDPIAIVAQTSDETFSEILHGSPRKVREILFSRFGIKAKKRPPGVLLGAKNDERARRLHARLKAAKSEVEGEVCRELIRAFLFARRPMLKAALDFLEVQNDNGLVAQEPDFFEKLDLEKVKSLTAYLERDFAKEEIAVYLRFVNVPHLDQVL